MSPYTETAIKNLQKGVKKMSKAMSPAAQVRRDFQLGRPAKALTDEPLHPAVVWARAEALLSDLRGRMTSVKLDPLAVRAFIVYVQMPDFTDPQFLALSGPNPPETYRQTALEALGAPDTLALGVLFQQWDDGKVATFPKQLTGLSELGMMTLRKAGALLNEATGLQVWKN
jgi:hypothetical protein